jgi:hypothetical protein
VLQISKGAFIFYNGKFNYYIVRNDVLSFRNIGTYCGWRADNDYLGFVV